MKRIKKWHILLAAFLIGVMVIGYTSQLEAYKVDTSTPKHYSNDYSGIKAYIVDKAEANGLDPLDIMAIIGCESHWRKDAFNVNKNGSIDLGLVQANSIHIKSGLITIECAGNPRCSINWLVEKRLRDGNYNSWVCAKGM